MKKSIFLLTTLFFLSYTNNYLNAQEQTSKPPDWIRQFDGIPIHTSFWWNPDGTTWFDYPPAIDSMVAAGVNVIQFDIFSNQHLRQLDSLKRHNLKAIGLSSMGLNWVLYYTEAKYSVWEAEVNSLDTLMYHKPTVMEEISDSGITYLRLKPTAANSIDTLIRGPYYIQDVGYYYYQNGRKTPTQEYVKYNAEFKLKLELNNQVPVNDTTSLRMTDTLCVLQVTQSKVDWVVSPNSTEGKFEIVCTYVIDSVFLTRADFSQLNTWGNFLIENYELISNQCNHVYNEPPNGRWERHNVAFKVIWLGNPQYLLSIDNITISDERGKELKDTLITPNIANQRILQQLSSLPSSWDSLLVGWIGLDEPNSSDNIIPIGKVRDILDDYSLKQRPLWHAWVGSLDGTWGSTPFGVMKNSRWRDFKKITGNLNIWQDAYLFDIPCDSGNDSDWVCIQGDYRDINIGVAVINYKGARELDPHFGVSLQCGAQIGDQVN